jgi:uncharacterized membrane protein YbhN (UPF0104 family)
MSKLPRPGGRLGTLALLTTLAIALTASIPGLRHAAAPIRHVSLMWFVVSVALKLASEVSYVVVFRLFFDRLPGAVGRQLAWTELASGVPLPAGGAGGLPIGGWLLHGAGAPARWIIRRSAGLYFLCAAVNTATLVTAGLMLAAGVPGPHGLTTVAVPTLLALALTLPLVALPAMLRSRPNAPRALRMIGAGVSEAQRTTFTRRPSWRLLGALGYLGFDVAGLWVALTALGGAPTLPALILAYNVGHLVKLVPIPGGIGTLDAGLTGALALYGVSPTRAAGAVLIYHAIALWVPGLGGMLAYLRLSPAVKRRQTGPATGPVVNTQQPYGE